MPRTATTSGVLTRGAARRASRGTSRAPACRASPASAGNLTDSPGRGRACIAGADAVINLAGASIGDKRWTPQRKAELRDSRHPRDAQPRRRRSRRRRDAAARLHQLQRRRLLRHVDRRRRRRPRASPPGSRLPRASLRGLGGRGAQGGARRHAARHHPQRPRPRAIGRRAGADDDAVPLLRRRPDGLGPPVHVVDSPARLDRDGALDRADAGGVRARSTSPRRTR